MFVSVYMYIYIIFMYKNGCACRGSPQIASAMRSASRRRRRGLHHLRGNKKSIPPLSPKDLGIGPSGAGGSSRLGHWGIPKRKAG